MQALHHVPNALLSALTDLPDRDDRKELREQRVEQQEHGEAHHRLASLHERRQIGPLRERQPWVGQGRDDDDEPLEPHADADGGTRHRDPRDGPEPAYRQDGHGDDEVAGHHRPERHLVRAGEFRHEDPHLFGLVAIVGGQVLGEGEVEPQQRHHEQQDRQVVEVHLLEVGLEVADLAEHNHGDHECRDPREDGADHEVGAEDRAVPHRLYGHREHERHDRMHAHGNRDDHDGHDGDRPLEYALLPDGPAPAHGEDVVHELELRLRVIAEHRDVGDQREVEIHDAPGEVGRDARGVPQQRGLVAAELDDVQEPIGPAEVDQDVHAADREDHHRDDLGDACDRPAPLGLGDAQDRADQRPGVADADEEDEVDDIEAPGHRAPHSRLAEAIPPLEAV